jgi:RecB family exonuclease
MSPSITRSTAIPGEGLDRCREEFIAASRNDPFGTWFVLPTHLLRDTVQSQILSSGIAVAGSRVCTPADLYQEVVRAGRPGLRLINRAEARFLLARCITETPSLQGVLYPGKSLPDSLQREVQDLVSVITRRQIAYPGCLGDLASEKSEAIASLIAIYHDSLEKNRVMDRDTLLLQACQVLDGPVPLPLDTVIWYGHPYMLALEREAFARVRSRSQDCRVLVPRIVCADGPGSAGLDDDTGNRVEIPPSSPGQMSRFLAATAADGSVTPGSVRSGRFSTRMAEFRSIAGTIAALHGSGVPYREIAVALPDIRGAYRELADVLSEYGIPYLAPPVVPLLSFPVVRFLAEGFRLPLADYPRGDLVSWVGSPYFRWPSQDGSEAVPTMAEVDLLSRHLGITGGRTGWSRGLEDSARLTGEDGGKTDIPGWLSGRSACIARYLSCLISRLSTLDASRPPREHLRAVTGFLLDLRIPVLDDRTVDSSLVSSEQSAFFRAGSLLRQVPGLPWADPDERVPFGSFVSAFTALARDEFLSAGTSPGVRIAGIRELAHLRFGHVFLAGLAEGAIPSPTTRLPLCTRPESQRMGARTLHEVVAEERFAFAAACLTAGDCLYVSCPESDGSGPVLPSVFFEDLSSAGGVLPWDSPPEAFSSRSLQMEAGKCMAAGDFEGASRLLPAGSSIREIAGRITAEDFHRQGHCDSVYDGVLQDIPEIVTRLQRWFGPDRTWSASQIETYASCPFRFFIERVLSISPLPDPDEDTAVRDFGNIAHQVLATYYRERTCKGLGMAGPGSVDTAHGDILGIAEGLLSAVRSRGPRWRALEREMTGGGYAGPGMLYRFLLYESQRSGTGLVPYRFELGFGMEDTGDGQELPAIDLNAEGPGLPFRLRGRIDRVDMTPDGLFIVTDYKTGSSVPGQKEVEKGVALQLPLYILAYQRLTGCPPAGGMYLGLKGEVKAGASVLTREGMLYAGLAARKGRDLDAFLEQTLQISGDHVMNIRSGRFPLPLGRGCPNRFCDARTACRFSSFRTVPDDEEAGEGPA